MKKIFIAILSAVMLMTACSSGKPSHDFINVDFGMSTLEIIEAEGEPSVYSSKENGLLYYDNKTVFGVNNAQIKYRIDENGLTFIICDYQNQYADLKSYQQEAEIIKENMIAIYGEPSSQDDSSVMWDGSDNSFGWGSFLLLMPNEESTNITITAYGK